MQIHRFLPQSLRTRVTLLTLLIVVAGFLVLGFYSKSLLREELLTYTGEQQRSALGLLASEVNHGLGDRFAALQAVALRITPGMQQDQSALQSLLKEQWFLARLFNGGVVVWNRQGQLQAEVQHSPGGLAAPLLAPEELTQVLAQGQAIIAQVQVDDKRKAAWMAMAVPVHGPAGEVIGALAGVIRLDQANFLSQLTALGYGETGHFFLVAAKQRLIFATSDQARWLEVLPPVGDNPSNDRFVQGFEGTMRSLNPQGEAVLVSVQQIPLAHWYASVTLSPEEAFGLIDVIKWPARAVALLLGLLCLSLIWLMLRRQLAPMTAAVKTLDGFVRQNQAPQALPVVLNDEVGQLVGGFNRLLGALAQQQKVLKQRELFNQAVVDSVSAEIAVLDHAGVILEVNQAWRRKETPGGGAFGEDRPAAVVGSNFLEACAGIVGNETVGEALRAQDGVRAVLDGHSPRFYLEYPSHLPQQQRWFSMSVTPLTQADLHGAVVLVEDISMRVQMEHQVREMAFYDPLTQLPNRRLALERLSQQLARARRARARLALLFIDLDKFKPINDELGHAVGDWLLKAVAGRILGCVRASDTAARMGGDEFVVVLPDLQTIEAALNVAEKIRQALAQEFVTGQGVVLSISSSIGVASYPDHGSNEHDLLRLGDEAMYNAKNSGGNAVRLCADRLSEPTLEANPDVAHVYVHLRWSAEFESGNAVLDQEHQTLFALVNNLLDSVDLRRQNPSDFEAAFEALMAHVEAHFAHEEAILLESGFDHLKTHAQQHQSLLARARMLHRQLHDGSDNRQAEAELISFLVSALVMGHLQQVDREFFPLFAKP